jgi:hypothetical protein
MPGMLIAHIHRHRRMLVLSWQRNRLKPKTRIENGRQHD